MQDTESLAFYVGDWSANLGPHGGPASPSPPQSPIFASLYAISLFRELSGSFLVLNSFFGAKPLFFFQHSCFICVIVIKLGNMKLATLVTLSYAAQWQVHFFVL